MKFERNRVAADSAAAALRSNGMDHQQPEFLEE
jgi:hypothetical protein